MTSQASRIGLGLALTAMVSLAGCSSSSSSSSSSSPGPSQGMQAVEGGVVNVVVTHPSAPPIAPSTTCTVTTQDAAHSEFEHVPVCTPLVYPHNPPMIGKHYPVWADFKEYSAPVPWGFLVHDLEHGSVVLAYHCDCPEVRAAFEKIVQDAPPDPVCGDTRHRLIIVPDPKLDVPLAAVAWGTEYKATCLDEASLDAFVTAHYAHGREDACSPGQDLSAQGWCP